MPKLKDHISESENHPGAACRIGSSSRNNTKAEGENAGIQRQRHTHAVAQNRIPIKCRDGPPPESMAIDWGGGPQHTGAVLNKL